jgi:ankyrin repeat protein
MTSRAGAILALLLVPSAATLAGQGQPRAVAARTSPPATASRAGDRRVADAARREDAAAIRDLVRQKADVNGTLPDGSTALHWVVQAGDADTVALLLQAGASVNAKDRYGVTPLYLAATTGDAAIVNRLLKAGAEPDAVGAAGETALIMSVRGGSMDTLKALLERGAAVNTGDRSTGETPLMWAARNNQLEGARELLAHGATVDQRTRVGDTPAFRPPNAGGGSHGLNIVRGGWPERGARDVIPGGMSALLYAARDGRPEMARLLLDAHAEVNLADANGISPLLMAITNDHMDVARVRLERDADVNAADWYGRTPLWAAVEIRNRDWTRGGEHGIDRPAVLDVVRALLDRGADPNPRIKEVPPIRRWVTGLGDLSWVNFTGQTPFLRAALSGDVTVMRLLLAKGADPKITTVGGTTALMAAAGVNWAYQHTYAESKALLLEAVTMCLDLGLDVNARNETGVTAVMGAANRGSDDILELLVEHGARLDVADQDGRTPMRWAQGEFLATHPPEAKPSTIALIRKLTGDGASAPPPARP